MREIERRVGLPNPWNINHFIDRLERYRGRDIDLCETTWTIGDSCGAWRRYTDHDVIAYPRNTSHWHQDVIILHEIGHIVSHHYGRCILTDQQAQRRAPDLKPAAVAHLLKPTNLQHEEYEAELIAMLLLRSIARQPPHRQRTSELAHRIEHTFGITQ